MAEVLARARRRPVFFKDMAYRSLTEEPRLAEVHAACLPHYRHLREARIRVP